MARIVSLHRYVLREGYEPGALVDAAAHAERRGVFELPGLEDYLFPQGDQGRAARAVRGALDL